MDTRQTIAEEVKQAFIRLGVVHGDAHAAKYTHHFETIANHLLSAPKTDTYKFVCRLVDHMKQRGCVFVTPAVCANRARITEVLELLQKVQPLDPENMLEEHRKYVRTCISTGAYKTVKSALVSPATGLPAWFRILESNFDDEVVEYYWEQAEEELAKDPMLAEYVRERFSGYKRNKRWSS